MKNSILTALIVMLILGLMMVVKPCEANDKVKHCLKQDGTIVVIQAGYPCPFGTHEL